MEIDETFISYALGYKDKRVREMGQPGSDDSQPIVVWKAEGKTLATLHCTHVERDHALEAITRLTPSFVADEITLAVDIHYTDKALDPRTNEPWAPGAMQNFCDGGDGCLLGYITDAIAVLGLNKAGEFYQVIAPYHVHKGDKTVAWQEREPVMISGDSTAHIEGLLPDTIREALATPTILEFAAQQGLDLAADRRTLLELQIETVMTVGADPRWVIFLHGQDEEERALIQAAADAMAARQQAMDMINNAMKKVIGR